MQNLCSVNVNKQKILKVLYKELVVSTCRQKAGEDIDGVKLYNPGKFNTNTEL